MCRIRFIFFTANSIFFNLENNIFPIDIILLNRVLIPKLLNDLLASLDLISVAFFLSKELQFKII